MSTGITFGGLSSGIDTEGIISKLIALEGQATNRLKARQTTLDTRAQVFGVLLDKISAAGQAAGRLNSGTAFNPVRTLSSEATVAAISGTAGAAEGTYALVVSRLAQAQKLASTAQSSTTEPLGRTGTFVVNGKAVRVEANDSLRAIAEKINGVGAGARASLIDGGAGAAYLTISSEKSGAANALQLADADGSVLNDLGVLGASDTAATGTLSRAFSSSTATLGSLLGATPPATSFAINGTSVSFDAATDTLQSLAAKINASGSGASASVEAVTVDGATAYRLSLSGVTSQGDAGGALHALGFLQRAAGNSLAAARDAAYTLDGVALTSAKNEVTGAIPGATVNLIKTGSSTLTVSRDTAEIKAQVNGFVQAANGALQYVKDASAFDKETYATGPLFGDASARQFVSTFSNSLFRDTGLAGSKYRNLASVGFSLDKDGLVQVDDAQFEKALADRPDEVRQLFQASGSTTVPGLSYVSSTSKTPASTGSGFDVAITRVATKGSFVGAVASSGPSAGPEALTFSGAAFGSATVVLALETGSTLASTIAKINADPRLKEVVVASDDGGKLRLDARKWGSGGRFDVVSDQSAGASNSGVGTGGQGTKVDGLDVAGTIAGGAATGFGQFLTADPTNLAAQGFQLQYTGSATGALGAIAFSKGLSGMVQETIASFNDATGGLLIQAQKSLQDSSTAIGDQIAKNGVALEQRTKDLRAKFAAMEAAISRLQAQGQKLASLNVAK